MYRGSMFAQKAIIYVLHLIRWFQEEGSRRFDVRNIQCIQKELVSGQFKIRGGVVFFPSAIISLFQRKHFILQCDWTYIVLLESEIL